MKEKLTTSSGAPVGDNQNSRTATSRGPITFEDGHLMEKLAHFNREKTPERIVHAKGSGAYGTFTVTNDVTKYTKAKFLNEIGKETETFVRFSTVAGEKGSADTVRDPRGFATRFYTEDGNYDLVGNNTPVFFIRDGIKFPDFIHTQKRNPVTGTKNFLAHWDFVSLSPETLHQITILFSDRGIPYSYRNMHGFGSHTFKWVNENNEVFFVKYHLKTQQGIKNIEDPKMADELAGTNPDFHRADLFDSIENGDYPKWTMYVQIMPYAEAETYRFDPFDVTKVWPHGDYPLVEVGVLELNKNPNSFHQEVEQVTFAPSNFVPGIEASPDKLLQARLFAYQDAARYRVGANHNDLYVNQPHATAVNNHQMDGHMSTKVQPEINYEPNSFSNVKESKTDDTSKYEINGQVGSFSYDNSDYYTQAGNLYRLLSTEERDRLTSNIAETMKGIPSYIIDRQIEHFTKADNDYGTQVRTKVDMINK